MKKILFIGCTVCLLLGALCGYLVAEITLPKAVETTCDEKEPVEPQKEDEISSNVSPQSNDPDWMDQSKDVVEKYIETMKSSDGGSWMKKLQKMKDNLSEDLYQQLLPADTSDTEETDSSEYYVGISDIDTTVMQHKDSITVMSIYKMKIIVNGSTNSTRYLMRATVKEADGRYVIDEIIEDSRLVDGFYDQTLK